MRSALWTVLLAAAAGSAAPSQQPRIAKSDFVYLGAFALPQETFGGSRFGYGGVGLGFYRNRSDGRATLFMQGHAWDPGFVAQIEVPAENNFVKSRDWHQLHEASVLQGFHDVTDGRLGTVGGGASIYGMMVYKERLIVGASVYYDAGGDQVNSHGVSGLNLSATGDFQGFFSMAGFANPRSKGGYMTVIPGEWQSLLGGPALTGKGGLPIISTNGCGPSATVFNPDSVGVRSPIPATTLLYYPLNDPLFPVDTQNAFFNLSTEIAGIAFPPGTRSVLFFGKHGTGPYCYGCGCESGTLGHPSCATGPDCPEYCYDPASGSKGTHAYPYVHQVWAYDADDLLSVKNGAASCSEVQPYAIWRMDELDTSGGASMAGAAYDPDSSRLYVTVGYGEEPHVNVYKIVLPPSGVIVPLMRAAAPRGAAGRRGYDIRGRIVGPAGAPAKAAGIILLFGPSQTSGVRQIAAGP